MKWTAPRSSPTPGTGLAIPAGLALFLLVVEPADARASGPLGPDGSPITTSDYSLDLYQGPVFAGTRVTGLAGAYVAIAEDVDGDLQNPASPAVRPFFSYRHFDYSLGFGLTFPATVEQTDFFNSGSSTHIANSPDSFVFFVPAVNLQWGEVGIGATLELQQYALSEGAQSGASRRAVGVTIPTAHFQFARGFDHNQWVAGFGFRYLSLSLDGPDPGKAAFESTGNGVELGVVWKPENVDLRVGVAWRSAIRTEAVYREDLLPDENSDIIVRTESGTAVYLPKTVALPWDLNVGFALQFGGRPLNPPWRTSGEIAERQTLAHRLRELDRQNALERDLVEATSRAERRQILKRYEREQTEDDEEYEREVADAERHIEGNLVAMNRFYVQVAASVLISGAVDRAVGVESLVSQTVDRSGQSFVVSPRLGVESGVAPEWLKLRVGSYLEPTRFEDSAPRLHGTLGVDLKLLPWNVFGLWPDDYVWRLGLAGDAASRYYAWGVSIGGWYPRHTTPPRLSVTEPDQWVSHTP